MQQTDSASAHSNIRALSIIGVLFFIFGFVSWMNAVLIPYFKLTCQLSDKQSMLVAFAFYISYFIMAIPSSAILKKTKFKNGMMFGLWIMAVGALIFIPAAMSRNYSLFLTGLFVQATGLTLLQTASNPYIVILGPIESAAQRISFMGICNKVAGALAPLLLIHLITKSDDEIDRIQQQLPTLSEVDQLQIMNELASRLILPYCCMALVLVALGLLIRYSHLPDVEDSESTEGELSDKNSIFQFPHLLLGALAIFCGVSVEVLAVDSIIGYAQHTGLPFSDAKYFATITLIFMIVSYVIGAITIPRFIRQRSMLQIIASIGLICTVATLVLQGSWSVWSVALLGFANALLWPSIWPLALDGVGKFTKQASALLIMGVVGGALTPLVYGAISDASTPQLAYIVLVPCYLFILYFASSGYKAGKAAG
ncbi:MAG TPA: sugar MFS transporter [Saprospiraceae bacterium]|nr:sugar MFS transporter [Saprospiraceae bacterium]